MPYMSLYHASIRIKNISFCDREIQRKQTKKSIFLFWNQPFQSSFWLLPLFRQFSLRLSPSWAHQSGILPKMLSERGGGPFLHKLLHVQKERRNFFNDSPTLGSNLRDYENPFHVLYITYVPLTLVCCTTEEQERGNCDSTNSPLQRSEINVA